MAIAMNSKQLHKHSVPILVLTFGLVLASSAGLSKLVVAGQNSQNTLAIILSERLFNVRPSANGFFHISRTISNPQADTEVLTGNKTNTPALPINMNLTGENAVLNIDLAPDTNQ